MTSKGLIIYSKGDPTVGIPSTSWELKGELIFEDFEEQERFKRAIAEAFEYQVDDAEVLTVEEVNALIIQDHLNLHTLKGYAGSREVYLDDQRLDPKPSQEYTNHSPDGFNWGYSGSGPAQLALAVMLKLTGKADHYQSFKSSVIASLPQNEDFSVDFSIDLKILKLFKSIPIS